MASDQTSSQDVPSSWVLGASQSHHADPHVAHFCLGLIPRSLPLTSLWWLAEEKGWVEDVESP